MRIQYVELIGNGVKLGSSLTSLKWDLEAVDKMLSKTDNQLPLPALREKIGAMLKVNDNTINTVRRIASELRPTILDDLGLLEAVEWQAQKFQARTGIVCDCDCSLEEISLNRDQSTVVFRIFQEALTNILRHAQATKVEIAMENLAAPELRSAALDSTTKPLRSGAAGSFILCFGTTWMIAANCTPAASGIVTSRC
jgi:signal transduction histidine kinase